MLMDLGLCEKGVEKLCKGFSPDLVPHGTYFFEVRRSFSGGGFLLLCTHHKGGWVSRSFGIGGVCVLS